MLDTILGVVRVGWGYASGAPWVWVLLVWVVSRYVPMADKIFQAVYVTANEIDRATDAILEEFEELSHIQTVSDISKEVKKILGRHYEKIPESKVEGEVLREIERKEGFSINWDDGVGKVNFNKRF